MVHSSPLVALACLLVACSVVSAFLAQQDLDQWKKGSVSYFLPPHLSPSSQKNQASCRVTFFQRERERSPDTLSVATIRIVHFSKMVILRCKLFLSSHTGRTKFFLLNFKGLQCFQTTIGLTRSLMFLMPKIYKVNSNLGQSFGTSIHFQSFNFIHHF